MHDDHHAVRGHPQIELDALGPGGERLPERLHRILGRMRGVAAMPNDGTTVGIEERMQQDSYQLTAISSAISYQLSAMTTLNPRDVSLGERSIPRVPLC